MNILSCSLTSAASGTAYLLSDAIDLSKRHIANRDVSVKCDIGGSAVSGVVQLVAAWSEISGGTYSYFASGQAGTTTFLTSGTSISGYGRNGSYLIPLYNIGIGTSGVTERFKTGGFLKIGACANKNDSPINIKIVVH
jgi:hypothetical protein